MSVASYESLTQEIRSNSTIVANLVVVTATGSATLVGFGVQLEQPGVFLAAFMLLIPTLTFAALQNDSTARIAAYIAVNYESSATDVFWETDLKALRDLRAPTKTSRLFRVYTLSFAVLDVLIGATCVVLAFRFLDYDSTSSVVAVSAFSAVGLALLALTVAHFFRVSSYNNIDKYRASWTIVRNARENGDASKQ